MKYLVGALLAFIIVQASAQEGGMKRPDIPGELMVDVGLNYWDEVGSNMDQKGWPSKSISISYSRNVRLSDNFRFLYGLGLAFDKVGFDNNKWIPYQLVDSLNNYAFAEVAFEDKDQLPKKYKIATTHIEVPLEMRYHPMGTTDGEGLFLGVGLIGGVLVKAYDKTVIELNGDKKKNKDIGIQGLNNFRYGIQFRIGFKGVHIFYKQYFSDFFDSDVRSLSFSRDPFNDLSAEPLFIEEKFFNPRMTTIGINITGF
ncbi:hypothetical protein [Ekhidna sp.]|uniref:hypothetical protein n=1 Tax=Ekhidna sp. TaxID=2608089 RepID=UPI003B5B1627